MIFWKLSSYIRTIPSASESHRIMQNCSWAIPPVGNRTLPRRLFLYEYYITATTHCQAFDQTWQQSCRFL